jgi:hypothetical protein
MDFDYMDWIILNDDGEWEVGCRPFAEPEAVETQPL